MRPVVSSRWVVTVNNTHRLITDKVETLQDVLTAVGAILQTEDPSPFLVYEIRLDPYDKFHQFIFEDETNED